MTSDIFIYCMIVFGLTYIVGHSVITQAIREWAFGPVSASEATPPPIDSTRRFIVTMIECPACLGFHVGWILGLVFGLGWYSIALGLFTTGTNLILAKLTRLMT